MNNNVENIKPGDRIIFLETGEYATVDIADHLELQATIDNGGGALCCLYEEVKKVSIKE